MKNTQDNLYLGVDGGGTKCRASLYDKNLNLLGTGLGGPSNPINGVQRTLFSITDAAKAAVKDAGYDESILSNVDAGIGLAGVNLPYLYDEISNWEHIFKSMYLTTDLNIACMGAHKSHVGAVFILGTGSVAFSRTLSTKEDIIIGGHGFLLGDKASGSWFGQQALKSILLSVDKIKPKTQMTGLIERQLSCSSKEIVVKMAGAIPRDFAQLAKVVFIAAENNDPAALVIIQEAVDYTEQVILKLLQTNPHRISLVGGITKLLLPWLNSVLVDQIKPQLETPEYGAALFIKQSIEQQAKQNIAN